MKNRLACLLMLLLAACGSLRNEVSLSLLTTEAEKLVVNSYISPQDTVLTVKVSRSKPVLGEQTEALPYNVPDATVTLGDGSKTVTLTYLTDKQWYQVRASQLSIVQGRTYTLTASTPADKRVTATATIPAPVPISRGILDSTVTTSNGRTQKTYTVRMEWQDPANTPNYYEYAAYFQWNPNGGYPISGQPTGLNYSLRTLSFARENRTGNLLTDDRQDGTVLTSLAATVGTVSGTTGRLSIDFPQAQIVLRLLSTEAQYYRYTDAVIRQRENRNNPFAEPVLIPSNIQGGLGCFAGYNRTERIVKVN